VIDLGIANHIDVYQKGEFTVADHPFYVAPPKRIPIATVKPEPPAIVTKPTSPKPPYIIVPVPPGTPGAGIAWKTTADGNGLIIAADPGGVTGVGIFDNSPVIGPQVQPAAGLLVAGGAEGGRAIGIAGAMIASLFLASGLVWAFYKSKPGLLPCFAGGAGANASAHSISAPTPGSFQMVAVANGSGSAGSALLEAQAVSAGAVMNGAAVGVSETSTFDGYFSAMSTETSVAVGTDEYLSMHRGIQTAATDDIDNAAAAAASAAAAAAAASAAEAEASAARAAANALLQQQQAAHQYSQQVSNYSEHNSTTMMRTYLNTMESYGGYHGGMDMVNAAEPSLMAAEEIRVDSIMMSSDGNYVITGSNFGPPQVWDMKSGNLVRTIAGEDFSSTDVHLAVGDSLLVGQVADMTEVDPNDTLAAHNLHHRKLQLWDFHTGHPLDMIQSEYCTASAMMSCGSKIVLGNADRSGKGTTVVIWDLLANEPIRRLHHQGSSDFAEFISFMALSTDNRYIICGFQNLFDNNANFVIFDLKTPESVEPLLLALDAEAEVTAILSNNEAVTGTRSGELVIWSMRTGKLLRQLAATEIAGGRAGAISPVAAHSSDVKAVVLSKDNTILVSASSDCTLKSWNMDSERLQHTFKGHSDEVWCAEISIDNDILTSGSKDGTIRLWKLSEGTQICQFFTGVDVYHVRMSKSKKTIVALGDKYGSRKLIMLQLVRSKQRSRNPSRCTSPRNRSRTISPLSS